MNQLITADYKSMEPLTLDIGLVIADPVYDTPMVQEIVDLIHMLDVPGIVFCSVLDLYELRNAPEQTCFWVKSSSTKNTVKRYSNFVEPITMWNGLKFAKPTHWSNRTGIFTDTIINNTVHPWKKPESLIEKLLTNHYTSGIVLDPCAGSGTVHDVCKRLGIPSLSYEIDPKYAR